MRYASLNLNLLKIRRSYVCCTHVSILYISFEVSRKRNTGHDRIWMGLYYTQQSPVAEGFSLTLQWSPDEVRSKSNKYEDSDIYSYTVRIPYFFSSFYLYPGRNSSSLSNRDMVAYGNVTTSSLSLLCLSWQVTLQGSAKRFSYVSWQREKGNEQNMKHWTRYNSFPVS